MMKNGQVATKGQRSGNEAATKGQRSGNEGATPIDCNNEEIVIV